MTSISEEQIVNSALWAAYGDALGFITELADKKILKTRTGKTTITSLIDWKRRVGGPFGTTIDLPKGSYSDDTQLRLATSRSIMGNGHFAIHSFSKIELPVWQAYALGAGRGSRVAANALSKNNVAWYNNFYETDKASYLNSGGNGAVMRIQPHVWSANKLDDPDTFLPDVINNSLTTHGNPRAIVGSVFHALSLSFTLFYKKLPTFENFRIFNQWTLEIPRIISQDANLKSIWLSHYQNSSDISLENSYVNVFNEFEELIVAAENWYKSDSRSYKSLATTLDLYKSETRGSGTLTALAASAASLLSLEIKVTTLIQDIVNELWTDTDSIATMVGAILGAKINEKPPESVQDEEYIIQEAQRLHCISKNKKVNSFHYHNNMTWKSPSSQLDFVGLYEKELVFFPFGIVTSLSSDTDSLKNKSSYYEWIRSSIGQSFLVKRRGFSEIKQVPIDFIGNQSNSSELERSGNTTSVPVDIKRQAEFDLISNQKVLINIDIDIDTLTTEAIKTGFNPNTIGSHIINIAESELGTNGVVAYSAIISKALRVRRKT
jgi:ADP-ribosylglycohydrolase